MDIDKIEEQVNENASKDRFFTMGSHIGDAQDVDWLPQAGSYLAAKIICDKLNEQYNTIIKLIK